MHTEPRSRSSSSQVLEAQGKVAPPRVLTSPLLSSGHAPSLVSIHAVPHTPSSVIFSSLWPHNSPSLSCSVFSRVFFGGGSAFAPLHPPPSLSLGASLLTPQGQRCFPRPSPSHVLLLLPTTYHPSRSHPAHPPLPPTHPIPSRPFSCPPPVPTPSRPCPRPPGTLKTASPHSRPQVTLNLYVLIHTTCLTFTYLAEDKVARPSSARRTFVSKEE